jgi:hypothetical protein
MHGDPRNSHCDCLDDEVERLREENAEIRKVAYPPTVELVAEVERLRAENTELRKAFESDEYAIEQAREVVRLRAEVER